MNLSFRRMRLADVPECHALHLLDRFAYDAAAFACLPDFWREIIHEGACVLFVVEDAERPPGSRIEAMEIAAFLSDDFAAAAKSGLPPYLPRQIVDRWRAGCSPLLDLAGVRAANARGGLTTLCLHSATRRPLLDPEAQATLVKGLEGYVQMCAGYQYREVLLETYGQEQTQWNLNTGLRLRTDHADFERTGVRPLHPAGMEPYLLGVTREEFAVSWGGALSLLFSWQPPRFFFTTREQELLEEALGGKSDEEAAETLAVARVTVRKRWQGLYDKVARIMPDLLPAEADSTAPGDRPSSQKKRLLLAYLRNHPEELRPVTPPEGLRLASR